MKGLWVILAVLVLCAGTVAAQAADRTPAALLPAEVGVYMELDLSGLAGGSTNAQALQGVFGVTDLMAMAQEAMAKDPKAQAEMQRIFSAVTEVGGSLGWRIGFGSVIDASALAGGKPTIFAVANVSNPAALDQALPELLKQLKAPVSNPSTEGDVTIRSFAGGQAALAQGKDWVAMTFPAEAVTRVTKLASGEDTASLAAAPDYQQALARVPRGAVLVQYVSGPLMKQLVGLASLAMPEAKLPAPPEQGAVMSVSVQVMEVQGRRVVQTVSQADLDFTTFLVQGPLKVMATAAAGEARESARKTQCLANVKNLSLAMNMYVTDHGKFPKADRWVTDLEDYMGGPDVLKCPSDDSDAKCSYGMNWGLSGKSLSTVKDAARKIVIYETAHPGDCPRGGKSDVASPPRHMGGNNYGYVDGHAKWLPEGNESQPELADW